MLCRLWIITFEIIQSSKKVSNKVPSRNEYNYLSRYHVCSVRNNIKLPETICTRNVNLRKPLGRHIIRHTDPEVLPLLFRTPLSFGAPCGRRSFGESFGVQKEHAVTDVNARETAMKKKKTKDSPSPCRRPKARKGTSMIMTRPR